MTRVRSEAGTGTSGLFAVLLGTVLLLTACVTSEPSRPAAGAIEDIRTSANDDREYRYLVLDNELRVLLISDADADKSAASLSVFRGNYDDPPGYPGLAHFLEHMLFIGTQKYPEPDGYFSFVQSHGGNSNAYTSTEHTNYFFDIQPEQFDEGLDRFGWFFIAPSFDAEYVEREKNAVDSEYRLRVKEDSWRGLMASKLAVNPAHPFSKFSIGNLETLGAGVHQALLEFFDKEYSANQMGLVVLDRRPLDDIEALVRPIFEQIENQELTRSKTEVPLFAPGQLPAVLTHQTLQQNDSVVFNFPLPLLDQYYREKPGAYLANLLGHEGQGSLHRVLTERGWITALGAGASRTDDKTSLMSIDISLTPQGRNHVPEIAGLVFDYIELLRGQPPERWRYNEQAKVAELAFRFLEQDPAADTVVRLSPELATYPARDLLTQAYLMEAFDAELIRACLSYLRPDNVLMELIGPDVQTTDVERWFQVGYSLELTPIPMAQTSARGLQLPEPNPYLPEDLEIGADDPALPALVTGDAAAEVWQDVDNEFRVPRATINISFRNEGGLVSLDDRVMADLYGRLVIDRLNTLSYPALLAGLAYDLATPPRGFRVSISGYHDKQLVLLDAVLDAFADLDIDPERFEVLKADSLRALRNASSDLPYLQTRRALNDLLLSSSWPTEAQADFLESVSPEALTQWRNKRLAGLDVLALVHGNVSPEDVPDLLEVLNRHLELKDIQPAVPDVRDIDSAWNHEVTIDHNDSTMVLHLQDPDDSFRSRALSSLMTQLLRSEYFSSLRTRQQLGYVVAALATPVYYRGGVTFLIQSPVAPVNVLEERTRDFIDQQVEVLDTMDQQTFDAHKAGLISLLTETDKNPGERSARFWSDLDQNVTTFDSQAQIADEVARLSMDDMRTFIADLSRRIGDQRLLVYSRGRFEAGAVTGAPL
jgi:insulysin